ncbi:MAG: phosphoglucosamine mutase [Candidatus Aminicenantaceae bacterium]
MTKLFGTDGMRAAAGEFPLDYGSVYTLGGALIRLLKAQGYTPQVLIGRDTRESGVWLEKALFQGIRGEGGEPISAGVIPTSAISYLTRDYSISAGVVISASHNPYQDNGIKIFTSLGMKISEQWESILEDAIRDARVDVEPAEIPIDPAPSFRSVYVDFLKSRFTPGHSQRCLKVVIDCSNGASSAFASEILKDLGFETQAIGCSPNGRNINLGCGSLHPEILARRVKESGADMGIAYDGDADRALWVDETGRILNGDHTLYVLSEHMQDKGRLSRDTVVATIMSNMGLEKALKARGLDLYRSRVGDKYVLEDMLKLGSNLGGEQSGHTILLDDCPTGDGMLTSIKMLEAMVASGATLSELVSGYREFPQVLQNVRVSRKEELSLFPEITNAMDRVLDELGDSGRLNVRYSGTEPVARIMVEGPDQDEIEKHAQSIAATIAQHLGK